MIKLTLVMETLEAEALMALCGGVSGSTDGPRGFFDLIYDALGGIDVDTDEDEYFSDAQTLAKDIWPGDNSIRKIKCERI